MNIEAKDLSKVYNSGENRVIALDHANLEIVSSDFISIMGPSGSGKSTLLHLLSGLDRPTSGIPQTKGGLTMYENDGGLLSPRDAYRLMLKDYPDVMDIGQMCEALGVSTKTGYKLLKDGKIEYLKIGRAYRIPKAHILRYLKITCATVAE